MKHTLCQKDLKKIVCFFIVSSFMVSLFFLLGCGVKGDPKPPLLYPNKKESGE